MNAVGYHVLKYLVLHKNRIFNLSHEMYCETKYLLRWKNSCSSDWWRFTKFHKLNWFLIENRHNFFFSTNEIFSNRWKKLQQFYCFYIQWKLKSPDTLLSDVSDLAAPLEFNHKLQYHWKYHASIEPNVKLFLFFSFFFYLKEIIFISYSIISWFNLNYLFIILEFYQSTFSLFPLFTRYVK